MHLINYQAVFKSTQQQHATLTVSSQCIAVLLQDSDARIIFATHVPLPCSANLVINVLRPLCELPPCICARLYSALTMCVSVSAVNPARSSPKSNPPIPAKKDATLIFLRIKKSLKSKRCSKICQPCLQHRKHSKILH